MTQNRSTQVPIVIVIAILAIVFVAGGLFDRFIIDYDTGYEGILTIQYTLSNGTKIERDYYSSGIKSIDIGYSFDGARGEVLEYVISFQRSDTNEECMVNTIGATSFKYTNHINSNTTIDN